MKSSLAKHEIVLLGAGHTNAHILRMWRMNALPRTRLTCISNFSVATYSGMLPGVLAGMYPMERMQIDLVRLCKSVGARLIVDRFTGVDPVGQQVLFANRSPVDFDVLSIGIGSVPSLGGVSEDDSILMIKPMQTFAARLEERLAQLKEKKFGETLQIAIVGAGAGGVELAFCLPQFLRKILGDASFKLSLINSDSSIPVGSIDRSQRIVKRELENRSVDLVFGKRVRSVRDGQLNFDDDSTRPADLAIWATNAVASEALEAIPLPKDDRGFILTDSTLRTVSGNPVFAVGDSGTIREEKLPKAGVYAVREGPVLWKNLLHTIESKSLEIYKPQRGFLKLLNLGDGTAIAEYKGFAIQSKWALKLKDRIDQKFMDKYQEYKPMEMSKQGNEQDEVAMRCTGCGSKVGGTILSRVLNRLEIASHPQVVIGLDQPDDAAVIKAEAGNAIAATVDFFTSPLEDAFLTGRIAALNAASDAFAMNAEPFAALAQIVIPAGRADRQEQLLFDLLSGSLHEFNQMKVALIGGHTIEGDQPMIGFTLLANQNEMRLTTKAQMRPGDVLVLTKPLGTGVLLVAHMQARCRSEWMETLLQSMLRSNQVAANCMRKFDVKTATDVTGFGLAGHLVELLKASHVSCQIELEKIPVLPGASELAAEGLESTLAPANRDAEHFIEADARIRESAIYSLLFDPQTSGGMLFAVPADQLEQVIDEMSQLGELACSPIGVVEPSREGSTIRVV